MPIVPTIPRPTWLPAITRGLQSNSADLRCPPFIHPGIAHQRRPTQGRLTQGRLTPDERTTLTTKASALHVAQVRH